MQRRLSPRHLEKHGFRIVFEDNPQADSPTRGPKVTDFPLIPAKHRMRHRRQMVSDRGIIDARLFDEDLVPRRLADRQASVETSVARIVIACMAAIEPKLAGLCFGHDTPPIC